MDNLLTLYHGSHNGLKGKISCQYHGLRTNCDFGKGFYAGDKEEQAKLLIVDDPAGTIYKLRADTAGLSVYQFDDEVLWALYIGINRGRLKVSKTQYPGLHRLAAKISGNDIIIGLIADDKMMPVYTDFLLGNISDKVLVECLKSVALGNQYVFKTAKACDKIEIIDSYTVQKSELKSLKAQNANARNTTSGLVGSLKVRYRRTGLYIDEILDAYK